MKTTMQRDGSTLTVLIEGRIDTQTAPDLQTELEAALDDATDLVLDFTQVGYISSAGLRTILTAQNRMNAKNGTMVLRGCSKNVLGVFKVTGFDSFLTIE